LIVDFLAANHLTRNAVLIEIKTPNTKLLGGKYRDGGIYGASDELSGAVAQVLSYRHSLNREFDRIGRDYREQLEAFSPQCLVVAGHAARDLAPERLQSFELFRDAVAGTVTGITYDELFGKVRALIEVLEGNNGTTAK
jgi:hypothetical protein